MASGPALLAVDRFLRFVTGNDNTVFGGKVLLLGGDFRQVLPVVPRGGREATVLNSIKNSALWHHIEVRPLTVNMRTQADQSDFSNYLLSIGEDKIDKLPESDLIRIPDDMVAGDIISAVYGEDFSEQAM